MPSPAVMASFETVDVATFAAVILHNYLHDPSIAFIEYARAILCHDGIGTPRGYMTIVQHLQDEATDNQLQLLMPMFHDALDIFLDPEHHDHYFFSDGVNSDPFLLALEAHFRVGAPLTPGRRAFMKRLCFALMSVWILDSQQGRHMSRVYRHAFNSTVGPQLFRVMLDAACGETDFINITVLETLHNSAYTHYRLEMGDGLDL